MASPPRSCSPRWMRMAICVPEDDVGKLRFNNGVDDVLGRG
jgi:hypothetical protein